MKETIVGPKKKSPDVFSSWEEVLGCGEAAMEV